MLSRPADVQDEALEAEGARPSVAPQGSDEHVKAHAEEDGTPLQLSVACVLELPLYPVLPSPECAPTGCCPEALLGWTCPKCCLSVC